MRSEKYDENFRMTKEEAKNMVESWLHYDYEIADLVLLALQGMQERVDSMEKSLIDKDVELLQDQTHSFKGVAGNFSMNEIYEILVNLDDYLKIHNIIDKNVEFFIQLLAKIIAYIPSEYYDMTISPPDLDYDVE